MKPRHFIDLDLNIARARTVLAPLTMLSIYLDSAAPDLTPWFRLTGGAMEIDRFALAVLFAHLVYSAALHAGINLYPMGRRFAVVSTVGDVLFAIVIAIFTEGPTSPSYAFFAFAIIAVAYRDGFWPTLLATGCSMLAYLGLILMSAQGETHYYLMRPIYLGITGYLIGFLGQQRINFEARVRELETQAERHSIARALHDGYVQALAAVGLRLSGCRRLIESGRVDAALAELADLEKGVGREYDEVRSYIRSLIDMRDDGRSPANHGETSFGIRTDFRARGAQAEHVLRILLEAVRNTLQHAHAMAATIEASGSEDRLRITVTDDGVGFPEDLEPPWSIASRVGELGGSLRVGRAAAGGAQLDIELPCAEPR